jgi:hypothetical protein
MEIPLDVVARDLRATCLVSGAGNARIAAMRNFGETLVTALRHRP